MKKKYTLTESQYTKLNSLLLEMKMRSYIFDWDDNILHMPTKIKMDKKEGDSWVPVEVSTEEFAQYRNDPNYRIRNNSVDEAFSNFRDYNAFLNDVEEAIHQQSFAPSYEKFKEALIYANNFAINTARGHNPKALRDGVRLFIDMVLEPSEKDTMVENIKDINSVLRELSASGVIDWYLDNMGEYYPVSSEEFAERFGLEGDAASNPEESKKLAIRHFIEKVFRNVEKLVDEGYSKMSVGFSDDDLGNVKAVEEFIEEELNRAFPDLHFVVYDTSDRGKRKMVIEKS
jgi:hypothetical protein